jgi:hypothetical protein
LSKKKEVLQLTKRKYCLKKHKFTQELLDRKVRKKKRFIQMNVAGMIKDTVKHNSQLNVLFKKAFTNHIGIHELGL